MSHLFNLLVNLSRDKIEEAFADQELTSLMFALGALHQMAEKGATLDLPGPGSGEEVQALVKVLDALVGEGLVEINTNGYVISAMGVAFDAQIWSMGRAVKGKLTE